MKVHFLGIGGSGASAAANLAKSQKFEITGCDKEINNEFTKEFDKSELFLEHDPSHLENIDILAVTPAIYSLDPNNPELVEAKNKKIPVLTWQQFLGEYLTKDKIVIAICGTHGKTTTTAMIAQLLEDADLDPTVELGAIHPKWGKNFRIGKGKYLVIEADEFNDNFLNFRPDITVVTNIEMDHPEYFKNFDAVKESFKKFLLQTKSMIVGNLQNETVAHLLKDIMKLSPVTCFDYSNNQYNLDLKVPGEFNQQNASAAFQVGLQLQIDPSIIRKSLESYQGVGRRFEYLGDFEEAKVYSDFGHHPTEIKVTMEAARNKFPNQKIYLFYQPHMFSRTKALFDDFVKVFQNLPVDGAVIYDIYPSREVDTGLVSSEELVKAINKKYIYFSKDINYKEFKQYSKPGDILFFMGAGDTDKWAKELVT
jgi:UDP-N-acetylmuramate--alanine ligase